METTNNTSAKAHKLIKKLSFLFVFFFAFNQLMAETTTTTTETNNPNYQLFKYIAMIVSFIIVVIAAKYTPRASSKKSKRVRINFRQSHHSTYYYHYLRSVMLCNKRKEEVA